MFQDGGWMYVNAKIAAARELARRPETMCNPSLQDEICRSYGVFIDSMTDDEVDEFEHLIESFDKKG